MSCDGQSDHVPEIHAGLQQAFAHGGFRAVEDFWKEEILGRRSVFCALLNDFQLPRLLAKTREIISPKGSPESEPEHTTSAGHYWMEELSAVIYAITNDSYHGNEDDGLIENEPHEQAMARIARAIITATEEAHNVGHH